MVVVTAQKGSWDAGSRRGQAFIVVHADDCSLCLLYRAADVQFRKGDSDESRVILRLPNSCVHKRVLDGTPEEAPELKWETYNDDGSGWVHIRNIDSAAGLVK